MIVFWHRKGLRNYKGPPISLYAEIRWNRLSYTSSLSAYSYLFKVCATAATFDCTKIRFWYLGIWLVWYRHISRHNGSVRCHVSNSSNFDSMCTGLEYSLSINHTVPWYPTLLEVPSTDWYVVRTQCTWFRYSPWGINYWPLNGKQSTMSVYIYYNMSCQTRELDYCYTTLMTLC